LGADHEHDPNVPCFTMEAAAEAAETEKTAITTSQS
jgi:hypothetical protein